MRLGDAGRFTSASQAFDAQSMRLGGPRDISASACSDVTSRVVRALPESSALPIVIALKVVEAAVVAHAFARRDRAALLLGFVLLFYYMSMLAHHVSQATRRKDMAPALDQHLSKLGIKSVEDMQAVDDKLIVVHDGGKTEELPTQLRKSSRCGKHDRVCVEYECCQ